MIKTVHIVFIFCVLLFSACLNQEKLDNSISKKVNDIKNTTSTSFVPLGFDAPDSLIH